MKRLGVLAIALIFGATSGCATEDAEGVVDVKWSIGGTKCSLVGVTRVQVTVLSDGRAVAQNEAPCEDLEMAVSGVPQGTFTVRALGYKDGSEVPAYVGQVTGIEVPKGGRVETPTIFLEEAPGAIDLKWRFESGDLCRFEGVHWVQVSIFDERLRKVADRGMACDPGADVGVPLVPDGAEYLADAVGVVFENMFSGPHDVLVLGYADSADTEAIYVGQAQLEVASFKLSSATVVLTPCEEGKDSLCQ